MQNKYPTSRPYYSPDTKWGVPVAVGISLMAVFSLPKDDGIRIVEDAAQLSSVAAFDTARLALRFNDGRSDIGGQNGTPPEVVGLSNPASEKDCFRIAVSGLSRPGVLMTTSICEGPKEVITRFNCFRDDAGKPVCKQF
jgi:hypothetical protein